VLTRFFDHRVLRWTAGVAFGLGVVLAASAGISGPAIAAPTAAPGVLSSGEPADPSTFTAPDPVSAQVDARAKDHKIEVLSELTESSTTYANPNGSFTTDVSAGQVRVADSSVKGGWRSLDYTLVKNADGTVGPKSGYVPITLSGAASAAQVAKTGVVSLTGTGGSSVSLGWGGALPAPSLSGDTATYANIQPNVDLVVKLTATGYEQYYVLKARPTNPDFTLSVPVVAPGLVSSQASNGSVSFKNAKKQLVASVSSPMMWDSSQPDGSPQRVEIPMGMTLGTTSTATPTPSVSTSTPAPTSPPSAVTATPTPTPKAVTATPTPAPSAVTATPTPTPSAAMPTPTPSAVTPAPTPGVTTPAPSAVTPTPSPTSRPAVPALNLSASAAFLSNPSTVYPVILDPSVATNPVHDIYVRSDNTVNYDASTELHEGDGGGYAARTFIDFSNASWNRNDIISATLNLWDFAAGSCTPTNMQVAAAGLISSSTSWADQPTVDTVQSTNYSFAYGDGAGCPAAAVAVPVTSVVQYLAGTAAGTAVGMRLDSNEANPAAWKAFYSMNATSHEPNLQVTYDNYPSTATTPTVSPAATIASTGSTIYTATSTPTFSSSAAESDGSQTSVTFDIDSDTTGDSVATCTSAVVPQSTQATCTPTTPLADGTYYVRALGVVAVTGHSQAWSGYTAFTVENAPPPTPVISCPGYPDDSWPDALPTSNVSCTASVAGPASGQSPFYELLTSVDGGAPTSTPINLWWAGAASASVSNTSGPHTVTVTAVAPSGVTASSTYEYGDGSAGMTSPIDHTETNDVVHVSASGPPAGASKVTAELKWRPAGTTGSLWNTATDTTDTTDTTPLALPVTVGEDGGEQVSDFAWSSQSATSDVTTGSTVTLDAREPALLDIEVCFEYSPGGEKCTFNSANPLQVQRVPHAFGAGYPVADAGDGQVALWTGELDVDQTDVTANTPGGGLTVSRTHSSFGDNDPADGAGAQDPNAGVFGPGWTASFAGLGAGAVGDQVLDNTTIDGTITLIDSDLTSEMFQEPGGGQTSAPIGTYTPADDPTAESGDQLKVTGSGLTATLTYTTTDGTVTTWAPVSTTAPIQWKPVSVQQPGGEGTENYLTDAEGRVIQILAPIPDGVVTCTGLSDAACQANKLVYCTASGTSGLLPAGCDALEITYDTNASKSENTDGSWNIPGQVTQIDYETYNPTTSASVDKVMVKYQYNQAGNLTGVVHPYTGDTNPAVTYTYTTASGDTLLASLTNEGQATTSYTYSTGANGPQLQNVRRGGAQSGGATSTESAYVYGINPSSSGLADFSATTDGRWGQNAAPTAGYAVFGADYAGNIDTDNATALTAESGWTAADWQYATLQYTDDEGFEINDAQFGAGEWLRSYTQYDETKDVETGSLDATQIDNAVKFNLGSAALQDEAVSRYNVPVDADDQPITVVATDPNDTTPVPSAYVTDQWSAPFMAEILQPDRSYLSEEVRTHTHYSYDQGAPLNPVTGTDHNNPITGQPYQLQTEVTVGLSATDATTTDPTATLAPDVQVLSDTISGYNPIDSSSVTGPTSGWTLGAPTVTRAVMSSTGTTGANDITTETLYNAQGDPIETVAPLSNGSDAGTTETVAYTADSSASRADCQNKPAWAGLPCWSGPVAQPTDASSVAPIASTEITGYDLWLNPTVTVETSGSAIRTTTITYNPDGTQNTTAVTSTIPNSDHDVPTTQVLYDPSTHAQVGTASVDGSGNVTSSDTTSYDLWGRPVRYTDSLGDVTTTSYVAPDSPGAGQVASVITPSGPSSTETTTYSYDGTDASGNVEHRGLATGLTVSGVGSFAGAYDADGNLVDQSMPGGLSQSWEYNDQGQVTSLTYSGVTEVNNTATTGPWLSWSQTYDGASRVADEWTPEDGITATGYTNQYTYDQASRLTGVLSAQTDNSGDATCAARQYTFDAQGNRVGLNQATAPMTGTITNEDPTPVCPTLGSGTTTSNAYDNLSRQLTGANGSGSYVYDAFGRQTTIPAADAPNGADAAINLSYNDTDAVQSIAQTLGSGSSAVTTTSTFGLDPDGRRQTETVANGTTTNTTTDHYADGSDSPSYASEVSGGSTQNSSYLPTLSGVSAVVNTTGGTTTASLDLSDLGGSTVASVNLPA
jgi:large repetitive protein